MSPYPRAVASRPHLFLKEGFELLQLHPRRRIEDTEGDRPVPDIVRDPVRISVRVRVFLPAHILLCIGHFSGYLVFFPAPFASALLLRLCFELCGCWIPRAIRTPLQLCFSMRIPAVISENFSWRNEKFRSGSVEQFRTCNHCLGHSAPFENRSKGKFYDARPTRLVAAVRSEICIPRPPQAQGPPMLAQIFRSTLPQCHSQVR